MLLVEISGKLAGQQDTSLRKKSASVIDHPNYWVFFLYIVDGQMAEG